LGEDAISTDGFNSFGIETRFLVIRALVFESDISLFSEENTG
jgi:hypothetical protein